MRHPIYDQPDAMSGRAPLDRILEALAENLLAVAEHLADARPDILAFTHPKTWRQIWANSPNDRLDRETHRTRWLASSSTATPQSGSSVPSCPKNPTTGPRARRYLGRDLLVRFRTALITSDQTTAEKADLIPTALVA